MFEMVLWSQQYDLVHAFDTRPNVILPALFYKYLYRVPLVIDWADWWDEVERYDSAEIIKLAFSPVETFLKNFSKVCKLYNRDNKSLHKRAKQLGISTTDF